MWNGIDTYFNYLLFCDMQGRLVNQISYLSVQIKIFHYTFVAKVNILV